MYDACNEKARTSTMGFIFPSPPTPISLIHSPHSETSRSDAGLAPINVQRLFRGTVPKLIYRGYIRICCRVGVAIGTGIALPYVGLTAAYFVFAGTGKRTFVA